MPGFVPGIHGFFAGTIMADSGHLARYMKPRPARPGFRRCTGFWIMTGSTRSSGGLDDRRKRLLFRCWHRGTREMDLILGRFADKEIASLTDSEMTELERLIDVPDPDLYAALTGEKELPSAYAGALFERLKTFRAVDQDQ
jgi:antitoxin CptB